MADKQGAGAAGLRIQLLRIWGGTADLAGDGLDDGSLGGVGCPGLKDHPDGALPNHITLFDLAVDPPALWDEQRERVGL